MVVKRKALQKHMKTMLQEHKDHPQKFKGGKKQAMAIAYSKTRRRKS
jgi:ABC-type polar amino acid transport system ATPase subunit|tara:strand:+ start:1335 stop:1475 length:141 start_codon:yes stop_codon:yes gene_type:complete